MYQKGFTNIALIGLVTALVGIAGYVVWSNQLLDVQAPLQTSTSTPQQVEGTNELTPSEPTQQNTISPVISNTSPGWQLIDRGSFTISLPPEWKFNRLQGEDSQVGEFVGDDIKLVFDYGWYSDPLIKENDPGYTVSYEAIGGHQAKVVVSKAAGSGTTGIHFADLGGGEQKVKLTIAGNGLTDSEQKVALQIFRSLHFK